MKILGRLEGLLVVIAGLYIGAYFLVFAFFLFLSLSAPTDPRLVIVTGLLALVTVACFVVAFRLVSRPSVPSMVVGALLIGLAATTYVAKQAGWNMQL